MFPEIRITDSIILPTYLVYLSLLYSFLVYWVYRSAIQQKVDLKIAMDISLCLMVGGFIGGRSLHILFEMPDYYFNNPSQILQFWQGGFVFYGGFVTALACGWTYLKIKKIPFLPWADFFSKVVALGYGLGRLGCFFAGCCYGRACTAPYASLWAVQFPWDTEQIPRHPTQIYATLWEFLAFAGLIWLSKKTKKAGTVFYTWLILHGLGRMMMEYYRDDFRGDLIFGFTISSWISFIIFSFGLVQLGLLLDKERSLSKS